MRIQQVHEYIHHRQRSPPLKNGPKNKRNRENGARQGGPNIHGEERETKSNISEAGAVVKTGTVLNERARLTGEGSCLRCPRVQASI